MLKWVVSAIVAGAIFGVSVQLFVSSKRQPVYITHPFVSCVDDPPSLSKSTLWPVDLPGDIWGVILPFPSRLEYYQQDYIVPKRTEQAIVFEGVGSRSVYSGMPGFVYAQNKQVQITCYDGNVRHHLSYQLVGDGEFKLINPSAKLTDKGYKFMNVVVEAGKKVRLEFSYHKNGQRMPPSKLFKEAETTKP